MYLIEILHQTTTVMNVYCYQARLYLIEILHQTTTLCQIPLLGFRCILSKFYIKPQLCAWPLHRPRVVSYRNSTSNHNKDNELLSSGFVVSYRNSTSNHNNERHNYSVLALYLIEILHQTTTRFVSSIFLFRCILSKFYIKPQLRVLWKIIVNGCILSKFYIKPQL